MSEEAHLSAESDPLAQNLSALEDLLEQMRNRDGGERHLLFEKALELVHACQALIDEEGDGA